MIITRYKNNEKLEFDIEFITPTFLGGADQNAELRSSPFKSALRYWWRVVYGAEFKDNKQLLQKESEIFGSTEQKSSVILEVSGNVTTTKERISNSQRIVININSKKVCIDILDYLAYGHHEYHRGQGNVYIHEYIKPGEKCRLSILFPKKYKKEVVTAAYYFFKYGCIGSKSRNGFGSLYTKWPENLDIYKPQVKKEVLEYTVFNNAVKLFKTKEKYISWDKALISLGTAYLNAKKGLEKQNGRHPKPLFLSVKKTTDNEYYGQILSIPIKFYESKKRNDTISYMNKKLLEQLEEDNSGIF